MSSCRTRKAEFVYSSRGTPGAALLPSPYDRTTGANHGWARYEQYADHVNPLRREFLNRSRTFCSFWAGCQPAPTPPPPPPPPRGYVLGSRAVSGTDDRVNDVHR